jgi:hypothetical protein
MSDELSSDLQQRPRGARSIRAALAVVLMSTGLCATSTVARAAPAQAEGQSCGPCGPWSVFAGFSSHAFAEAGFHLGGEYALMRSEHFESMLHLAFQAYGFGAIETGYALQLRWGQRYTASYGLTLDSYLGIGAQYSQWENTVFTFKDDRAEAEKQTRSGASLIPHVVIGPGYDLSRLFAIPLHIYARAGLLLLYPDMNDVFHLSAVAEIGIRWVPR